MILLKRPSNEQIARFISSQTDEPFSYEEVGATRKDLPGGYTIDLNRAKVGSGEPIFFRAVKGLEAWRHFDLGWIKAVPAGKTLAVGCVVALVTRQFGFWSLNACRIVYLFEEDGPSKKFGFAYGTLAEHAERGEERFIVEWNREDDSVWYEILAFSKPNQLFAKAALPLVRLLQKRFARDSMRCLAEFVNNDR
jgi:uncharacterized protein (UPF0548 family)